MEDYEQLTDGRFVVSNKNGIDFGWFTVPYGFVSDGDSIPEWVRCFWDRDELRRLRLRYAIGHDYLYKMKTVCSVRIPRLTADMFYLNGLLSEGLFPPWRAWTEWVCIRLFGWWYWFFVP